MIQIIRKGNHRPRNWWKSLAIWYNKKKISRLFSFSFSCKYVFEGNKQPDQQDHNKLFGIGYFWNKKQSARIGWRYDPATGLFILSAYCHIYGKIVFEDICDAVVNRNYIGTIEIEKNRYYFEVRNSDDKLIRGATYISKPHNKKLAYALGLYFGGNNVAPQDMSLTIKKV